MKVKGAEWNAFYNDDDYWKQGIWYDCLVLVVNGEEVEEGHEHVEPTATVEFDSGVVYFDDNQTKSESFDTFFKKWRKQVKMKTVGVGIPRELFDEICEQLKARGCKIYN